ncbi:MAG TPA: DUF4249 domain-containing protein [Cytophagales bacterium]|nr:DUF4249 domain-containing protein [Cytophagales bacterium]
MYKIELKKKTDASLFGKERFFSVYFLICMLAVLLFNNSCVTPITLDITEAPDKLVVEGWITDNPGPYEVRLTLTAKYSLGHLGVNEGVEGATVSIIDNQGKEAFLEGKGLGFYHTREDEIQGEIGNSYKLRIKIGEKVYESKGETILKAPEIDNIYYEYKDSTIFYDDGFYTYVDFKDQKDQENYYQWSWKRYQERFDCGVVPDDHLVRHWRGKTKICCTPCYDIRECTECLNIFSDQHFQGQDIIGRLVTVYPYDGRQKVVLEVIQQSISKEAYVYFNSVIQQNKNSGNVFDTPPFPIKGNITNVNDPNEDVLGFFGAAGESHSFILLNRTEVIRPPLTNYDFNRPVCGGNCGTPEEPRCCPPCGGCEENGPIINTPEEVKILLRN